MAGIPINVQCVLGAAKTTINHTDGTCCPLPPGRLDGNEKGGPGGKSWPGKPKNMGKVDEALNLLWDG